MLRYLENDAVAEPELVALYNSVGWGAYTSDPASLLRAVTGSTLVVTAREDGRLVGLARVISDGVSICYLQDVLVQQGAHRRGIGRELVTRVLAPFAQVRQKVLLTDDDPAQAAFYLSLGYSPVSLPLRAFIRSDQSPKLGERR